MAIVLNEAGLSGQASVVERLIGYLNDDKKSEFLSRLNSIDMWGGSGAVWEVYIENESSQKESNDLLYDLLVKMKKSKIKNLHAYKLTSIFKK